MVDLDWKADAAEVQVSAASGGDPGAARAQSRTPARVERLEAGPRGAAAREDYWQEKSRAFRRRNVTQALADVEEAHRRREAADFSLVKQSRDLVDLYGQASLLQSTRLLRQHPLPGNSPLVTILETRKEAVPTAVPLTLSVLPPERTPAGQRASAGRVAGNMERVAAVAEANALAAVQAKAAREAAAAEAAAEAAEAAAEAAGDGGQGGEGREEGTVAGPGPPAVPAASADTSFAALPFRAAGGSPLGSPARPEVKRLQQPPSQNVSSHTLVSAKSVPDDMSLVPTEEWEMVRLDLHHFRNEAQELKAVAQKLQAENADLRSRAEGSEDRAKTVTSSSLHEVNRLKVKYQKENVKNIKLEKELKQWKVTSEKEFLAKLANESRKEELEAALAESQEALRVSQGQVEHMQKYLNLMNQELHNVKAHLVELQMKAPIHTQGTQCTILKGDITDMQVRFAAERPAPPLADFQPADLLPSQAFEARQKEKAAQKAREATVRAGESPDAPGGVEPGGPVNANSRRRRRRMASTRRSSLFEL